MCKYSKDVFRTRIKVKAPFFFPWLPWSCSLVLNQGLKSQSLHEHEQNIMLLMMLESKKGLGELMGHLSLFNLGDNTLRRLQLMN